METLFLPSIFVPVIGIIFPLMGMALLFIFIEQEDIN